jgi:hypothetical protein
MSIDGASAIAMSISGVAAQPDPNHIDAEAPEIGDADQPDNEANNEANVEDGAGCNF